MRPTRDQRQVPTSATNATAAKACPEHAEMSTPYYARRDVYPLPSKDEGWGPEKRHDSVAATASLASSHVAPLSLEEALRPSIVDVTHTALRRVSDSFVVEAGREAIKNALETCSCVCHSAISWLRGEAFRADVAVDVNEEKEQGTLRPPFWPYRPELRPGKAWSDCSPASATADSLSHELGALRQEGDTWAERLWMGKISPRTSHADTLVGAERTRIEGEGDLAGNPSSESHETLRISNTLALEFHGEREYDADVEDLEETDHRSENNAENLMGASYALRTSASNAFPATFDTWTITTGVTSSMASLQIRRTWMRSIRHVEDIYDAEVVNTASSGSSERWYSDFETGLVQLYDRERDSPPPPYQARAQDALTFKDVLVDAWTDRMHQADRVWLTEQEMAVRWAFHHGVFDERIIDDRFRSLDGNRTTTDEQRRASEQLFLESAGRREGADSPMNQRGHRVADSAVYASDDSLDGLFRV